MKRRLQQFLKAMDEALLAAAGETARLDLYPIGRAALVLQHDLVLPPGGTKDLDVVQVHYPAGGLLATAVELFGKGTKGASVHELYLELVMVGLPPVPGWFEKRSTPMEGEWRVLRVWQLEVHDLAVTKMKSFRSQDREDIQFLCEQGKLQAEPLEQSLAKAFLWSTAKDGDPDYDRAFANLGKVKQYLSGRISTL